MSNESISTARKRYRARYRELSPLKKRYVDIAMKRTNRACQNFRIYQDPITSLSLLKDSVEMAEFYPETEIASEIAELTRKREREEPRRDYKQYDPFSGFNLCMGEE